MRTINVHIAHIVQISILYDGYTKHALHMSILLLYNGAQKPLLSCFILARFIHNYICVCNVILCGL